MRFPVLAFLLLPFLAACGGRGSTSSTIPSVGDVSSTARQIQNAALAPEPAATEASNDLLYVGNVGSNSITVYHHDQQGNSAPLYVIAGSKTGLSKPGELSEDAQGNLYVANGSAILVFAHGAQGNVAPIRRLAGSLTGIHDATAMTVDQTTGKIFVMNATPNGEGDDVTLLRFPPNSTGDAAPFAQSAAGPGLDIAQQMVSDSTGNNVIETFTPYDVQDNGNGYGVGTLEKQFSNGASLDYKYYVWQFAANGVADDPTTKTYLATNEAGIFRFDEDTDGYGPDDDGGTEHYVPALVSTITSDKCGGQLVLGYLRNIYVTHAKVGGCSTDAIYVYTHDSSGNASPLRVLTGSATKLNQPYGIYEGK